VVLGLQVATLLATPTAVIGQAASTARVPTADMQASTPPAVPPGYTIGAEDVLSVTVWKEPDMSVDSVVVRPDGKISLPLINELDAASLTPEQLRAVITERAAKFVAEPTVSVVVREIRSRRVFITGSVANPGAFPLGGGTTVLQLIALAGGLTEFANKKNIVVTRQENGRSVVLPFNYSDITKGKNLNQNVVLRPGDTVVVP
jgi:polysaccharide export outer membrane protein